jgi:hypothetical protein
MGSWNYAIVQSAGGQVPTASELMSIGQVLNSAVQNGPGR